APLIASCEEALAYAVVRMPATYGAAAAALKSAAELYDGEVYSLLDAGAGCGAVGWAAKEIFPSIVSAVGVERDPRLSALGEALMERGDYPLDFEWRREDLNLAALPAADLVAASYVLNELSPPKRRTLVERLWAATGKMLVLVEPGTPAAFAGLLETRRLLLSLGAEILAPCPGNHDCPLPEDDWCHFTVRVPRSRLHKRLKGGDAPYEDEKYCFLAAAREGTKPCSARVLRHPRIEPGRVALRLCTPDGVADRIVTARDGKDFKRARKSNSGDRF
ncbi:MAG: small ribosomal subunit Rsm22 family protein, partial [Eubacterium sp.]|nr:small ribosomal subunit Rsm22 family protein [Eubacterium sp.]